MEFNTRVVTLLAQLGYQEETPDSIAATCKGNLKRIWEFLLDNARPAAECDRIGRAVREYQQQQELNSAAASRAARAGALREQLCVLRRECSQVERTLVQQQEELRLQARAVVDESGEALLAEQEQRDAELLTLALGCFTQRSSRFAGLISDRHAELSASSVRARGRQDQQHPGGGAAAPSARPGAAAHMLEELQQLVDLVRQEMQQALDLQADAIAEMPAPGAAGPLLGHSAQASDCSGDGGGGARRARPRAVAGHAPSPELSERLAALQLRPPAALLACACALADRSVSRLRALLAGGEAAAAAANAAVAQLPEEIKQRRALMPWTTSPADAALAEGGAGDDCGSSSVGAGDAADGARPDADELIRLRQRAHLKLCLDARRASKAAAAARARLEGLLGRPELGPLQGSEGARAAAAVWLGVQSKRAEVAALQALQGQLLTELRRRQEAEGALRGKWGEITEFMAEYRRQAALLCYLSEDSAALSGELGAQARAARGAVSGELAPACASARAASRAARGAAARETAAAARAPLRALVAGAPGGLLAGPTGVRFRLASQHLCRAGAAVAASTSSGVGAVGAAAASIDPAMAAALEAASDLDELAPVRCPAELMAGVVGGCRRARDQQRLLSSLEEQATAGAERLAAAKADAARLRAQVGALRTADVAQRLPLLEEALAEGRRAREFADCAVKGALTDWWHQPAQHLVPGVTHEGRGCSEWLTEVQALHGRLRELGGGQVA